MWTDYLAGVTRDTTPVPIPSKLTTGYKSVRGTTPSEMNQFSPHAGNHILRVSLKDSPAFHKRLRILSIRREQEDEIIDQLTTSGLAGDEPSKFRLFLGDPALIDKVRPEGVVVPHVHIRPYRHREAKTKPAAVAIVPNKLHTGGVRSIGRRPVEVWGSRIVHMDCPEAPPQFALVRPSKQSFSCRYPFDLVFGPDLDFI
ncbi:MAG: hypothetical protein EHM80_06300 [Nitrospiraceae bacterium]|nr:MAG: hypothetical protein EHM80_06300 [Nitrospiraceae bacterium]